MSESNAGVPRSDGMIAAAYYLSRCGVRHPGKSSHPPAALQAASWKEAYDYFYEAMGDGRSPSSFRNSLKNARDTFDRRIDNGRKGWEDAEGQNFGLGTQFARIWERWDALSDAEVESYVLGLAEGKDEKGEGAAAHSPSGGRSPKVERLANAQQRKVSAAHIHNAVHRLLAGEDAPNFAESRDYDVRLDDGTRLAPKKVFGLALEEALGITAYPEHFSAGWSQPSFEIIQAAGYRIVSKSAPAPEEVAEALAGLPPEQADVDVVEGNLKLVSHFKRERASGLSRKKKAAFLAEHGKLFCERCKMEPAESYDAGVADACIEVHHAETQVKDMEEGHQTSLDDLRCLCANCHRVTHRELAISGQ